MSNIKLVVDSACDIPQDLLETWGILQVPVWVNWQGKEYRDKLDLDLPDLFGRVAGELPTTSQPSAGQFVEAYKVLAGHCTEILSFHIASKLSGTFASAVAGAQLAAENLVKVFDTRSISMGAGLQALAAAQVLREGGSAQKALAVAAAVRDKMEIFLILDTLEWVLKGGRVSRLQATLGMLLNIKPMLRVSEGVITAYGKARSRARSLQQLLDTVVSRCLSNDGENFVVALGQGGAEKDQDWFWNELTRLLPRAEIIRYQVGIAIGAHGGPGVLGVCLYNR